MFPKTSRLGSFIAEEGSDIIELDERLGYIEPVLYVGSHHGSGPLRTKGERSAPSILEDIHLLVHYIGILSDTTGKKPHFLKGRSAYFLIAESISYTAEEFLNIMPKGCFFG